MRRVIDLDDPSNCFPSLHTTFAFLAALYIWHGTDDRICQAVGWAVAVVIAITTLTTGQHYLIDVPGGIVLAFVSFFLVRKIEVEIRATNSK